MYSSCCVRRWFKICVIDVYVKELLGVHFAVNETDNAAVARQNDEPHSGVRRLPGCVVWK